jgi:type VI secretion system protein ImpC
LAAPRFLVRVPYGAKGEPCEIVPFEEVDADRPAHDGFLWGNGALLCAIVLGESAANDRPWATQGTVDNLPFYVARVDGDPTAIPCAEALLSQRSVMHLLDRGLTALASERDGDAVRIARLQSISRPPTPLAFRPEER